MYIDVDVDVDIFVDLDVDTNDLQPPPVYKDGT